MKLCRRLADGPEEEEAEKREGRVVGGEERAKGALGEEGHTKEGGVDGLESICGQDSHSSVS